MFFSHNYFAQDCTCLDSYKWLKNTFEENDAGFDYILKQKGQQAYNQHNERIESSVKELKVNLDCAAKLLEWLFFFRQGHIGISVLDPKISSPEKPLSTSDERITITEASLIKKLSGNNNPSYEGIWQNDSYKVGVIKREGKYLGFILDSDNPNWEKGMIKFELKQLENVNYEAVYYMGDHSIQKFKDVTLTEDIILEMGFVSFSRIFPKLSKSKELERYVKIMGASSPHVQQLTSKTLLLRIPDFSWSKKQAIDSVLSANKALIYSTENLIIDIRNNGGGSDMSYDSILPIIYTNPIRLIGMEMLSTELNNQRMKDFINNPDFPENQKGRMRDALVQLEANLGEFVNLDSTIVDEVTFDKISDFPKKVGILINEGNGSTSEQFLLAAKQSTKVKLFGTTTTGALDISNMNFVKGPCEHFGLSYGLSKSYRIPDMAIDGKGISPDYFIDKSIPKYGWIDYTLNVLEQ